MQLVAFVRGRSAKCTLSRIENLRSLLAFQDGIRLLLGALLNDYQTLFVSETKYRHFIFFITFHFQGRMFLRRCLTVLRSGEYLCHRRKRANISPYFYSPSCSLRREEQIYYSENTPYSHQSIILVEIFETDPANHL